MSYTLRHYIAEHRKEIKAVKFICCNIIAPPKRDVLAYLGIPTEPGKLAEKLTNVLLRRAETDVREFTESFQGPALTEPTASLPILSQGN